MKKSKKVLSFIMAVAMLSSIVSVAATAYAPYKDGSTPASAYNDVDQPVYTLDQCSSMVLDYVDEMLKDMEDIDITVAKIRLNSVDNALTDIYGLATGGLWTIAKGLLGDLKDLDVSAISSARRASTPANTADTNVIYSLLDFLNDNKSILSKAVDGSLDMGIANSFVDLGDIDVANMAKSALYESAYPIEQYPTYYDVNKDPPATITQSCDTMLQQIINGLIVGYDDPLTAEVDPDGLFPALAGYIDIVNSTAFAYDFGEDFLKNIYNIVLVPLLNTEFKVAVRELCGVVYDPLVPTDPGNESNLNEYAAILDIHYTVPVHTFAPGSTFISDLNNILFEIIDAVTVSYTAWTPGNNSLALDNFAAAAKYVLKYTDSSFFKDYVAKATDAEIDAMGNQALFSYIARSVLNSSIDESNIPADADTLVEVVWYALKEVLAQKVPEVNYATNANTPKTLDGIFNMLGDLIVYSVNQASDMNPAAGTTPGTGLLPYVQNFDATLLSVMKWVKANYGGLLNLTLSDTDGWAALNTLVFSIIPSNWLPASIGGSTKELLKNRVFGDILDLDTGSLFALFDHVAGNDLSSKTIKKVILETIARLLNLIFPGALKSTYTTLDALINNAELKVVIETLLAQLYTRRTSIIPVVLPLLTNSMGISTPEEYSNPDLLLPNQIKAATTFAIRNDSSGLNTGATAANGTFVQDALYKIQIKSIETNIPAITPTNLVDQWINGGDALNCTLSGTFAANQVLMVTMTYDVYTERGTKLTDSPLTARAFAYISADVDDGVNYTTLNPETANTHTMKYKNIYCNQNYTLAGLAAQDQFIVERETTSSTDNSKAATVTRTSATANATLIASGITAAPFTNIATTYDGGAWNVQPFAVATAATRPANAAYSSTFGYKATATKALLGKDESFSVTHYVVFYDDFNLPGLLNSEIATKRDPSNYTDANIWDEYISALQNAVAVQYRPRIASSFMSLQAPAFENAFTMLTDAVTALKTCEVAAPVTALKTALDSYEPPNTGLEFDDPGYSFMDLEDYVPYTYNRYSDERDAARSLYNSQQPPVAPTPLPVDPAPTPEQIAAYNTAYTAWQDALAKFNLNRTNLKPVDIAYALHRLELYGSRLVPVAAQTDRFTEDLARINGLSLVAGQYTTLSWAAYQRALTFANLVNSELGAKAVSGYDQTKVNTAREELLAAHKELIRVCDYTQLFAYIAEGVALLPDVAEYTTATWATFTAALTAAQNCALQMPLNLANQAIIDALASALRAGIDGLVKIAIDVILEAIQPSVVIGVGSFDTFLAGLGVGIGADGYVDASEGGYVVFTDGPGGAGTNAIVELKTDAGVLLKTYTVLIYGDVNGDANITGIDAGIATNVENYLIVWDTDEAFGVTGDVNHDGNITGTDAGIMVNIENYAQDINQATGIVG